MSFINPQTKLFEHLDRLALIKEGERPAPVNVEIDLSNRCSLGCEWCHFAFTHTRGPLAGKREKPPGAVLGGDLMTIELAESIIDQLTEAGVCSITWTGGGEPTLHPNFDRVILYAKDKIEQGIYTHGGHIDGWRAELMKGIFRFVYVSLDAADPVAYKRDKRVDRFGAACAGIRRLANAPGDATIGVGYLITKENWREAAKAVTLARDLGADYIQFRPTILYEQTNPSQPSDDREWISEAIPFLEYAADQWDKVEVDIDRFRMYQDWKEHGYKTCFWSALQTVITPNGKIWTCVNKREQPGAELGDLSHESFKEVWERHKAADVNSDCRVLCRGHLPNITLDQIMKRQPHGAFI
jgi:MoaA/NifB/PqqE/SkfB family radical SAM enzyme